MDKKVVPTAELNVASKSKGFMTVDLAVRNHQLIIDEPLQMGGADLGITPIEAGVSGLTACTSIIIRVLAKKMGYQVNAVDVQATSQFDLRGVMFMEEIDVPFTRIDLNIQIEGELSSEQVEKLAQQVSAYCPMYKLFTQAGTEVVENWHLVR